MNEKYATYEYSRLITKAENLTELRDVFRSIGRSNLTPFEKSVMYERVIEKAKKVVDRGNTNG